MTDIFEVTTPTTGDGRRLARSATHRGVEIFEHWDRTEPFDPVPELSWRWDAPFPLDDLVPTTDSVRVMSPRMAGVVRSVASEADLARVQWLQGTVVTADEVEHPVEVPHFLEYPDVYDEAATDWGPSGLPIRWVLSRPKVEGLQFFARTRSSGSFLVSEQLRDALVEAGITGMDIRRARATG